MDQYAIRLLKKILSQTRDYKIIVYKGLDLSLNYYPVTNPRKYTDIDLCIRQSDYFHVKQIISKIPKILLLKHESLIARAIHGHALYIDLETKLKIELHIAKDPCNVFEYLMGREYVGFFNNLAAVKVGKERYYSLSRPEYLYVIIRQLLKQISLGTRMFDAETLGTWGRDFSCIVKKMSLEDWGKTSLFLDSSIIFMRFYNYYSYRVWYLFLCLLSQKEQQKVPYFFREKLEKSLDLEITKEIKGVVVLLQTGKRVNLKKLLESRSVFLLLCRAVVAFVQPWFFRWRELVNVR